MPLGRGPHLDLDGSGFQVLEAEAARRVGPGQLDRVVVVVDDGAHDRQPDRFPRDVHHHTGDHGARLELEHAFVVRGPHGFDRGGSVVDMRDAQRERPVGQAAQAEARLELSNQQQMLWAMWSEPTHTMLHEVSCPTLIVASGGRQPVANPEFMERRRANVEAAHAAITNSRVAWIPGTGHDIGYEKPRELANALSEFLAGI